MRHTKILGFSAIMFASVLGCSTEESNLVKADVELNLLSSSSGSLLLTNPIHTRKQFPLSTSCTDPGSDLSGRPFQAQDGVSGAPESLKILLKGIELRHREDNRTSVLYESAEGTEISLSNGKVSLDGITLNNELEEGTYTSVVLKVGEVGKVKGCIAGTFNGTDTCSEDNATCEPQSSEPVGESIDGDRSFNYCTKSAYGIDALASAAGDSLSRAVYKGGDAEETNILLRRVGMGDPLTVDLNATTDFEFALPQALDVSEGADLTVSILMDLNIFLKFDFNIRNYEGNTFGGSENYSDMTDKAFFSSAYLPDVSMVFFGTAGSIEGYDINICYDMGSGAQFTRNWMTLIFDADDKLLSGTTATFDPTGYVALNGTINGEDSAVRATTKSGSSYNFLLGRDGPGQGSLGGFERLEEEGDMGYVEFGGGTKTSLEVATEGASDFDWHYTLMLKSSN